MIFFEGSGTIDKGVTPKDLNLSRIDTAIGCVIQVVTAAGMILCGAALYGHIHDVSNAGPSDILRALDHVTGRWAAILFGSWIVQLGVL